MRVFEGLVVSVPGATTAVVEIVRRTPHPMYKKLIKRSKKFKVETEGREVAVGARVKIVETKPISKEKYFKLVEPVVRKKGVKKNGTT